MYRAADLRTLADTIAGLSGPGTEVLWASPDAGLDDRFGRAFFARLRGHGFELFDISEEPAAAEARELVVATYEYSGRGPVHIIRMVRGVEDRILIDEDGGGGSGKGERRHAAARL
jgi:hypothetical protein